jgi:hypothetical protein
MGEVVVGLGEHLNDGEVSTFFSRERGTPRGRE